jgi:RHS repeat-associated protein
VILPEGDHLEFSGTTGGGFTAPDGRYDHLVHNGDGSWELTLQRSRSKLSFSAAGILTAKTDDYGNALTYTYGTDERLQRVADAAGSGRYLDIYWGANGRISDIQDHTGRNIHYAYDGYGMLTSVTNPLGQNTTYTYVPGRYSRMLSRITDHWARVITDLSWDALGRIGSYTEKGETFTYLYAYQGASSKTGKRDNAGNTWVYSFDQTGLIGDRVPPGNADGASSSTTYYADGSIQMATDELGVQTYYTYLTDGRIGSVTKAYSSPDAVRYDSTYDTQFPSKVASVKPHVPVSGANEPNWPGVRYEYHQAGSAAPGALARQYAVRSDGQTDDLVSAVNYNIHGQPLTATDATGATTEYEYDAAGNLIAETRPANSDGGPRPVTTYGYDALGRATSITSPLGAQTLFVYDGNDRILSVTLPKPTPSSTLSYVTLYTYDLIVAGHPGLIFSEVIDANGGKQKQAHDQFGRLVKRIDAFGQITSFTYDGAALTSTNDANGNLTTYNYDSMQRLRSITYPDGSADRYDYRVDGLLRQTTDRKAQIVVYAYDALKRLTQKRYQNGSMVTFTYAGQKLIAIVDTSVTPAETHSFTYDDRFRTTSAQQASRGTVHYTYDAGSRVSTHTVAGGPTKSYAYYPNGALKAISWSPIVGQFDYTYRLDGLYETITLPNGQSRHYTHDDQARLTQLANTHPVAGDLGTFDYGYDFDAAGDATFLGLRTSRTTAAGVERYQYDVGRQLIRVDEPSGSIRSWTYDGLGSRTTSTSDGATTAYLYQKIGTNVNNWLRPVSEGSIAYAYDANGNTIMKGGQLLQWDTENRLIGLSGTIVGSYQYDYQNRRTRKTINGTTTYLYDGLNLIRESAAIDADYLMGASIDEPLALLRGGQISYYVADGLGSITALGDANGIIQNTYAYDAWGVTISSVEHTPQPFGYTARETADAGPFAYYRYRYYDASLGRFASEDPLSALAVRARADGHFRDARVLPEYVYARNSPAMYKDPLGLDPGGSGGPTGCVNACIETMTYDTFKCLKVFSIQQLGCAIAFVGCVGLTGGTASPGCLLALGLCETWAGTNWFNCSSDVKFGYLKCLKTCC